MPRISQLPSLTTADNSDEIAIVDVSASVTKKITRGELLKAPLPNNAVTTPSIANSAVTASKIDFTTFDLPTVDGWTVKQEGNHKTYTREFTYGGGGDFTTASYTLPASLTMSGVFIDMSCYQTGTAGAYELSWTMLFSNATTFFFYRKKLGTSNVGESKIVVKLTVK